MFYVVSKFYNQRAVRDRLNPDSTMTLERADIIGGIHFHLPTAQQAAQDLAAKNPEVSYCVLTVSNVYEARRPEIINKIINNSGELVNE